MKTSNLLFTSLTIFLGVEYDLHYHSLEEQIKGKESWTYYDAGYYSFYEKLEEIKYSIARNIVDNGDIAFHRFEEAHTKDKNSILYQIYSSYNHLKRTSPISFHKTPVKPSLADGYYTYALKPSNNYKEYGSSYSYVSIRYDKDVFGSDFGKFDRNTAFIVNQSTGNVRKLSQEESREYFKEDNLFNPIMNIFRGK